MRVKKISTLIEHSANANISLEYKGKGKFGKIPQWVKERQLEKYYSSMAEFYTECFSEIELPKRFNKKELVRRFIADFRAFIREDKDFTDLIAKLMQNYPACPINNKTASEYIIGLKNLSQQVADVGRKQNSRYALNALRLNIPFIVLSNLYLGSYTISYFHACKAKTTDLYFRRNHFLIRERPNLRRKRNALSQYFEMLKPIEESFRILLKFQFQLWLNVELSKYESEKDFPKKPKEMGTYEINQDKVLLLKEKHENILEKIRSQIYDIDPTIFNPTNYRHEPTENLWKNMILIGANE